MRTALRILDQLQDLRRGKRQAFADRIGASDKHLTLTLDMRCWLRQRSASSSHDSQLLRGAPT